MNGTTPLNTPRMIYHWKEERKGNLECHLRISVSLRRSELWGGFANRPEFSEINAQLFVSRVRVRSGRAREKSTYRRTRGKSPAPAILLLNSFGQKLSLDKIKDLIPILW